MNIQGKTCIAGAYEHPTRSAPDKTVAQLHAECAIGALADAGLSLRDVDGYFCAGDAPGLGALNMADYLGLRCKYMDSTDSGGSSYLLHVSRAVQAITDEKCNVALITQAGRSRSEARTGTRPRNAMHNVPDEPFELPYGVVTVNNYALVAARHMYDWGTTPEQLAWIKVAASAHAQHNPYAMLPNKVTVADVLASPLIADPLRRMDCCVVSDGGGALIITRTEIAKSLGQTLVSVRGAGEAFKGHSGGRVDLSFSAAAESGKTAFDEARIKPVDIQYASIYDSFTITVLMQLEDLGFCAKGAGGHFVADGNLIAGVGKLPINTDGGGLCNNHPANRGGMIKIIEAVRQLRGSAHPAVQVKNCALALVQGMGGHLGSRHSSATLILERQ